MIGEGDITLGIGDADMAARRHGVAGLVIVHPLGQQRAPVIGNFDMADRRDGLGLAVIDDLVRLKQHGRVFAGRLGCGDAQLGRLGDQRDQGAGTQRDKADDGSTHQ